MEGRFWLVGLVGSRPADVTSVYFTSVRACRLPWQLFRLRPYTQTMRLSALALVLLAGCPAEPNVAAGNFDDGGQVGDVGDAGTAEPDAGDVGDDAGAPPADGDDEPEPPPPEPVPTLELACGTGEPACPTWVQGFSGTLECSPQGTCGIRCDVFVPCTTSVVGPGRAEALRECQRKDVEDRSFKPDQAAASACSSLGGACVTLYEENGRGPGHDGDRSWCVAD